MVARRRLLEDLSWLEATHKSSYISRMLTSVPLTLSPSSQRAPLARSEFLRLHLKAPSSSKIVSLYLFDAIVRHAREVIKKDGAGHDPVEILPSVAKAADPRAAFVTAAKDFLREMSTIVEDITTDVAARVKPEQRVSGNGSAIWLAEAVQDQPYSIRTHTDPSTGKSLPCSHRKRSRRSSRSGGRQEHSMTLCWTKRLLLQRRLEHLRRRHQHHHHPR